VYHLKIPASGPQGLADLVRDSSSCLFVPFNFLECIVWPRVRPPPIHICILVA